jgi:hypothetical protein
MSEEEKKALTDFEETVFDRDDMQEFINLHKSYCRMVAIDAHVKYLYLLLDDFSDAPTDDQNRFMNKLYENRDLMEENEK